jgi:hypothetical protein
MIGVGNYLYWLNEDYRPARALRREVSRCACCGRGSRSNALGDRDCGCVSKCLELGRCAAGPPVWSSPCHSGKPPRRKPRKTPPRNKRERREQRGA